MGKSGRLPGSTNERREGETYQPVVPLRVLHDTQPVSSDPDTWEPPVREHKGSPTQKAAGGGENLRMGGESQGEPLNQQEAKTWEYRRVGRRDVCPPTDQTELREFLQTYENPNTLLDLEKRVRPPRRVDVRRITDVSDLEGRHANRDHPKSCAPVRVYTTYSKLSLFCPIQIGNSTVHALLDTGAGINMANTRYINSLVKGKPAPASPSPDITVTRGNLTVRVADGKMWKLTQKAEINYLVRGKQFRNTFWLSPDLKEDMLMGMPGLRAQNVSINIGRDPQQDSITLRDHGVTVSLVHFPHGISSTKLNLIADEYVKVPAGTGRYVRVVVEDGGVRWPRGSTLTGLVRPPVARHYSALPMESINSIKDDGSTVIFVKNHLGTARVITPSNVLGQFQPAQVQTRCDKGGNAYLYPSANGTLHTRVDYVDLHTQAVISEPAPVAPISAIPVAVRKVTYDEGTVTEHTIKLQGPDQLQYALANNIALADPDKVEEAMDARVSGPDPSVTQGYTWRDVTINPALSPQDTDLVVRLLKKHSEFFQSLQQTYPNPKLPEWTQLHIRLKEGATPWQARSYPLSEYKRLKMREKIRFQLKTGMIRHSSSQYASPAFLVAKSGGDFRLVQDMRLLNANIEKNCWPIPRIDEIVDKMHGSKYYTSIDLADGFHQIGIDEDSRKYTAFITEDGLYESNTLSMGLSVAPNWFQYCMDRILGGMGSPAEAAPPVAEGAPEAERPPNLIGGDCFIYIDDCLVFSRTLKEHLEKLDRVITRLSSFGLRAKATKVSVAMNSLEFLGFTLSEDGRAPSRKKVQAILDIPRPSGRKAKSQIQAIIGMAGYYRKHYQAFEEVIEPLRGLTATSADPDRDWGGAHDEALARFKRLLMTHPVLAYPDFDQPFMVKVDASKTHVAGVLSQM